MMIHRQTDRQVVSTVKSVSLICDLNLNVCDMCAVAGANSIHFCEGKLLRAPGETAWHRHSCGKSLLESDPLQR